MRARQVLAALVACSCLVTTAACGPQDDRGADGRPAPSSTFPPPSPDAGAVPPARRAPSAVTPAAPTSVLLPSGRTVPVAAVGTTGAGLLAVPDDVDEAGWWRGGSRIGDPFGSILVAAHVDSTTEGLGPFAELLEVAPGARVELAGTDLGQAFEVRERRLVPQGSLTDDSWIFAASGPGRLTLVTCAPPFDRDRGGYQNLAVVTAVPLGRPEAS